MTSPTSSSFDVASVVQDLVRGSRVIDLSRVRHNSNAHAGLRPLAMLAWWLLGAELPDGLTIKMPTTRPAVRVLARSGLLAVAHARDIAIDRGSHRPRSSGALRPQREVPLVNVDWETYDDPNAALDRLRVLPTLADPGFVQPPPVRESRRYLWVDRLGAASALDDKAARRFNGDADQVLYELIGNVLTWSRARRALAVCGVTRGGSSTTGGRDSWNRLHVVVMDDGRGIPAAVEAKRAAEGLSPDWSSEVAAVAANEPSLTLDDPSDLDSALLYLLVERAFGLRQVGSTEEGHGLATTGVLANQWCGQVDLISTTASQAEDASVVRVSKFRGNVRSHPRPALPGARGTLVHVTLNAVADDTARAEASAFEEENLQLALPV